MSDAEYRPFDVCQFHGPETVYVECRRCASLRRYCASRRAREVDMPRQLWLFADAPRVPPLLVAAIAAILHGPSFADARDEAARQFWASIPRDSVYPSGRNRYHGD